MQPTSASAAAAVEPSVTEPMPSTTSNESRAEGSEEGAFAERLGEVVDGIRDDERRVNRAMSRLSAGREMDAVELVRVQSLVYGYSQRVDLASKVVESATSGLKQMLNTQV